MAMTDDEFEGALKKLGLQTDQYSSGTETPVTSDGEQVGSSADEDVNLQAAPQPPQQNDRLQGLLTGSVKPDNSNDEQMVKNYLGVDQTQPDASDTTDKDQAHIDAMSNEADVSKNMPSTAPAAAPATPPAPATPSPAPAAPAETNPLEASDLNVNAMKNAQQTARLQNLVTDVGEAGGTFAALASGKPFDASFYKQARDQNQQGVKDIDDRRNAVIKNMTAAQMMTDIATKNMTLDREKKLLDPNSTESAAIRNMVTRFEPKLAQDPNFQKMSGKDVKDFMEHFLESEAKLETAKANKATANAFTEKRLTDAEQKTTNNDFMKFGKQVQGSIASSRGDFGKNSNVIRQAGQLEKLIQQVKAQPASDPDKRQYFELARQLDGMLSSGQGTITGTKELMPETARSKFGTLMEYITATPQGAGLQDFVKRAEETIRREKEYAVQRNAETVAKMAPGFSHLRTADTDRWNQILNAQGLETDDEGNITGMRDTKPLTSPTPEATVTGTPAATPTSPAPVTTTPLAANEEKRLTKDNKTAIFDKNTKKFLRYE